MNKHFFFPTQRSWKILIYNGYCHNPSLGFVTKARGCKVAGQEGDPGVTSHAPRNAKSVRE